MIYVNQAFLFRLIRTKEGLVFLPQDIFFQIPAGNFIIQFIIRTCL